MAKKYKKIYTDIDVCAYLKKSGVFLKLLVFIYNQNKAYIHGFFSGLQTSFSAFLRQLSVLFSVKLKLSKDLNKI